MTFFQGKVYKIVREVPKGKVMTYKQVAKLAGHPKAYRAVGNILNKNPNPKIIPCHRVIKSDGRVGGYRDGAKRKTALLKKEGVIIRNGRVLNINNK